MSKLPRYYGICVYLASCWHLISPKEDLQKKPYPILIYLLMDDHYLGYI
jgi:hypothetical protein